MLKAAIEGAGLAYLSDAAVQAVVADGLLVRVLTGWMPPRQVLAFSIPAPSRARGIACFTETVRQVNIAMKNP